MTDPAHKTLLLVYHSWTGATEQMIRAVARGAACEPDLTVRLLHAPDAGPDDVLGADGYVFATPENLAAISGLMKDFFDRSYYGALDRINGRPYASLICAGSDGSNAARQIARIATGWRLRAGLSSQRSPIVSVSRSLRSMASSAYKETVSTL